MPPPSAEQWVVKVERDYARFGKQTWWRIEGDAPGGAAAGERIVRLQAHEIPISTHPSNPYPQPLTLAPTATRRTRRAATSTTARPTWCEATATALHGRLQVDCPRPSWDCAVSASRSYSPT